MNKTFHLTQAGIDELNAEREELLKKRVETAEAIKTAREMGDLSENAEYQSAKQDQERNDARLEEVEFILANVKLIKSDGKSKFVILGSTVTLQDANGKEIICQIVGTIEADPIAKKISDESPIGKALLGKKEGESVEIVTPVSSTAYTIQSIR